LILDFIFVDNSNPKAGCFAGPSGNRDGRQGG